MVRIVLNEIHLAIAALTDYFDELKVLLGCSSSLLARLLLNFSRLVSHELAT